MMRLENSDLVAVIRETWWHESHGWRTVTEGSRLFRRDRRGAGGAGVLSSM